MQMLLVTVTTSHKVAKTASLPSSKKKILKEAVNKTATVQHITMIVLNSVVYLNPFLTHKIGCEWLNYKNNADRLQLQLARDL